LAATSRLTDTLSSSQSTFIVVSVVLLRSAGCVTLPSLPIILRPAVTYLAGLLGVLIAKFTETSLIQPDVMPMIINSSSGLPNPQLPLQTNTNGGGSGGGSLSGSRRTSAVDHESRVMAARRRRTSSAALTSTQASAASSVATGQSGATQGGTTGNNKVRRTSLPALLANKKDNLLVSVSPSINSISSVILFSVFSVTSKSTGDFASGPFVEFIEKGNLLFTHSSFAGLVFVFCFCFASACSRSYYIVSAPPCLVTCVRPR
jgi:hypothetical protein